MCKLGVSFHVWAQKINPGLIFVYILLLSEDSLMNFSFEESCEMGSKTQSEENFNLFYFLLRCSNTSYCDILLDFFCSKPMFRVPLIARLNYWVYAHPTLKIVWARSSWMDIYFGGGFSGCFFFQLYFLLLLFSESTL